MAKQSPSLVTGEPKNVFFKPIKVDLRDFFKALAKGVGHAATGKWEELCTDSVEALTATGLSTEPSELAFLLVRRSIMKALFDLVGESANQQLSEIKKDESSIVDALDQTIAVSEIDLNSKFLDRPADLECIGWIQALLRQWLEAHLIAKATAAAIVDRFPSYFVYALNQEWRRNAKSYTPLLEAMSTPFTKAGERDWGWSLYIALLQRRTQECIFDEPFSLAQIFVPLNAYYLEDQAEQTPEEGSGARKPKQRNVVLLEQELDEWLQKSDPADVVRVISGGPGSGKSSFARIFAAKVAQRGKLKALFIPLHLIDASKDLSEEVGRFVQDEGLLTQNPLDPSSPEANLLIIFDGLDELASQGKAATETARSFLREVEKTVERRNMNKLQLRILISGRELVIQENESELRRAKQVISLLPYYVPEAREDEHRSQSEEPYKDPRKLLSNDLRNEWWTNYGSLTGRSYTGMPVELRRRDLEDVTSQPLLNYLVALSFTRQPLDAKREKLDFTGDINLNRIYGDLVAAVHERAYEKKRPYAPIRNMSLADFSRVLEEIGLAAWHGDGRSTTIREIEEHCQTSGVGRLLETFREGAEAGVTRLLAAFFFRRYGQRQSGDPTFVFTHKSFGEYLAARRIVRAIERIARELEGRAKSPDGGWDEKDALRHWAQVCGPSPISTYLHSFLLNEVKLRPKDAKEWQEHLVKLFSFILRNSMPMEQLQLGTFRAAMLQSRNAEESLLVAMNACARVSKAISEIVHPDPVAFGAWFKRIQGQRTGAFNGPAADCLSFLDLSHVFIDIGDFYGANLELSNLSNIEADFATFNHANLEGANLRQGTFRGAHFEGARLYGADLTNANLVEANLKHVARNGVLLDGADVRETAWEAPLRRKARSQMRAPVPQK